INFLVFNHISAVVYFCHILPVILDYFHPANIQFLRFKQENLSTMNNTSSLMGSQGTSGSCAGAIRALTLELKGLQTSPVEGFTVTANEDNMFVWTVALYGPPGTLYQVNNFNFN
ncbi:unnamed protein product, partial [Onchocerca flexuosa]|uniref:UBIQUITIN_CONJUGAT_2 domain-containing protein n=1 Tax=Onchocerca flexuosa TaxID=387005 RepID=A0A183HQG0_9BILA